MRCQCNGLLKVILQQGKDQVYECLRCKTQYIWKVLKGVVE